MQYQNKRMASALRPLLSSPVTVIAAPPGYGKTESVRYFLGKRKTVQSVWAEGEAPPVLPETGTAELTVLVLDAADLAPGEMVRRVLAWAGEGMDRRAAFLCRTVTADLAPLLYERRCAFVGKEDLAFTREEAEDYYRRRGLRLSEAVWERTEGWPVMLRLSGDYGGVLSEACEGKMSEYVRSEVVSALPVTVREALLRLPERSGKTERLLLEYARDGLLEYGGEFRVHPLLLRELEAEDALLFGKSRNGARSGTRLPEGALRYSVAAKITG